MKADFSWDRSAAEYVKDWPAARGQEIRPEAGRAVSRNRAGAASKKQR